MSKPKADYAALIVWDDPWRGNWDEVLDGLTMREAENVAGEQRRRGAKMASVHKAATARKLARPIVEAEGGA